MSENTARERQTQERFEFMHEASGVLLKFFEKGVKSSNALAVMLGVYGYQFKSSRLTYFFNFKVKDVELLSALQDCLTKIESHESN